MENNIILQHLNILNTHSFSLSLSLSLQFQRQFKNNEIKIKHINLYVSEVKIK
jgi:hypothetical protein